MKRSEVRGFIRLGIEALSNAYAFNSGRVSEFNSNRSNTYPFLWLESLSTSTSINASTTNPFESWNVVIHVADLDKADSTPVEYEAIVDACDLIAQQLIRQYNINLMYSDLTVIEGITREPFIHKHADNTTGVILAFTLTDYNSTNLCV